jgi:hypothetical protein
MKKNFKKKLGLNKKTIVNLEKISMGNILGGVLTNDTCPPHCEYTLLRCTYADECITQQSGPTSG